VLPAKIAAAGDSITQAFAASCTCNTTFSCLVCLLGGDQPENSWFDGTSGSVFSVYQRYQQIGPGIASDKSAAADGSEMVGGSNNFSTQADKILAESPLPDQVEMELGGNDFCNRDCVNPSDCGNPLYTAQQWTAGLEAGLDKLVAGLPLGSIILVGSVPRVFDLYQAGIDKQNSTSNVNCQNVWSTFSVCRIVTNNGTLNGESQATRLAGVAAQQQIYNQILRSEAAAYTSNSNGRNPRGIEVLTDYVDETTPSIGTFHFHAADIDGGDCFHPSLQGPNTAASLAWAANPDH
jgi:hypothetical protein